jgi:hypothetical protein
VSFSNDGTKIFAAGGPATVRRYECEVCLPLSALTDVIAARPGRALSADERARYVPKNWLIDWMVAR